LLHPLALLLLDGLLLPVNHLALIGPPRRGNVTTAIILQTVRFALLLAPVNCI
jgi:hypothetical protein